MDLVTLAMARKSDGEEITVDTAMSDTSTNPVQNRVIKQAISSAITNAFSGITEFSYYICQEGEYNASTHKPTLASPDKQHIYLVPDDGEYLEYIWISGSNYEMVGTTEVDLSGYVQEEELEDYALKSELPDVPEISTDIFDDAASDEKTASPKAVYDYATFVRSLIPELANYAADVTDRAATPKAVKDYADAIAAQIPTVPVISTSSSMAVDIESDDKTASPKAVKTYVAGKFCTDVSAYGDYDTLLTTPKAVKTYVDGKVPSNLVTGKNKNNVDTPYTLKVSTSAPASGTSSSIITIVVPS